MKQTLRTIIKFSIILAILGLILFLIMPNSAFGYSLMMISLILGQITGVTIFLIESKIYKTRFFRFIQIGIVSFIVGTLFRIQHWVGTSIIILISFLLIGLTYISWFISKKLKSFIDFIKVVWLILALIAYYFKIKHWYFADLLMYISFGVLWAGMLFDLYTEYKSKQIEK
jgi:hypothetical protein